MASRPPGDLKHKTNPHRIALGPPPASPSLHRASFQKSARGGRTPKRFYRLFFGTAAQMTTRLYGSMSGRVSTLLA